MIKVKLLNDNGYCGFDGVEFPLVVKAEECGRGCLVEGSEFIKLGICEPCRPDEFLYFNSDNFEVIMTNISNIAKVLSTIQVGDEPAVLDCSPELAESIWFNYVYYREHRQFELVVERFGKSSCKVSIRRWEDSPDHTVNGNMAGPFAFLALILTILGMLWLM